MKTNILSMKLKLILFMLVIPYLGIFCQSIEIDTFCIKRTVLTEIYKDNKKCKYLKKEYFKQNLKLSNEIKSKIKLLKQNDSLTFLNYKFKKNLVEIEKKEKKQVKIRKRKTTIRKYFILLVVFLSGGVFI